jgi:hypothetical protein
MVIKVDASKMMEILFENSEEYPNYVYIHLMYLLKEYNDNKENQEEIKEYISKLDIQLKSKIQKCIKEPCCQINITCENPCTRSCFQMCTAILIVFCFVVGIGTVVYCVATSKRESTRFPPSIKNITLK